MPAGHQLQPMQGMKYWLIHIWIVYCAFNRLLTQKGVNEQFALVLSSIPFSINFLDITQSSNEKYRMARWRSIKY